MSENINELDLPNILLDANHTHNYNTHTVTKYRPIDLINPLTSPGEGVTVFTSPYLSAGAPALCEAKGLIILIMIFTKN